MSNNIANVRAVYRDTAGNVRVNGLLYLYENNTTTLATNIFSDEALTVSQSNPYVLDSFGTVAGDLKFTGKLTVKATNYDGGLPFTDNNVQAGLQSTNITIIEQFEVIASDPVALTMKVKAGNVMNGETLVAKAAQTTTAIVAPIANPRIDRVVINRLTGTYSIITGAEGASPTAPAITADNMPSAQILLQTTSTVITDSMITDERVSGSADHSNANATETLTNKTIGDTNTINAQDDAFAVQDSADPTLQILFNAAGTTGTSTTLTSSQTANRVITVPDVTDTLAGIAATQTLTNKTIDLTNNTVTGTTAEFNTALSDDDFATVTGTETLTNKTLTSPTVSGLTLSDSSIVFEGATPDAFETTLTVTDPTADRTVTHQDATYTVVGRDTTDTLTNKTLTLPQINDTSADHQYIYTVSELTADRNVNLPLLGGNDEFTFNAHTQTLTNKTLTLPKINDASSDHQYVTAVNELTADRTVTLPLLTLDDEYTFNGHAQTLTNKTLTSPTHTGTTTVATLVNATLTQNGGYYTAETTSTSLGSTALDSLDTGSARSCTAVGDAALTANTTGIENCAFGKSALTANTTGGNNCAFGTDALTTSTVASNNSAFGTDALRTNTGGNNCGFGDNTLANNTANSNSAFGKSALAVNTSGSDNNAFGSLALDANTTGGNNCAFGSAALSTVTTTSDNCAFGDSALQVSTAARNNAFGSGALNSSTSGGDNNAFGTSALSGVTTGTDNTAIGDSAGQSTTTGINNTMLGNNAASTAAGASNEFTLGNSSVSVLRCQQTTITALSDRRDKDNIQDLDLGLGFIENLKPVSFDWNMRDGGKVGIADTGFIAQDLKQAQEEEGHLPGLVYESNPEKLEAGYGKLLPVMVKAIQELSDQVRLLQKEISTLKEA